MPIHSCYFPPSYLNSIPSSKCSFSNPSIRSSRLGFGASQLFHREKWIRSRNSTFVGIKHVIRASLNSDYYSTLKLKRTATLQEIKTAYKNLARQYHPDLNKSPGAEDKFKEISAAYEVLSDEEKRSVYDRFGEAGLRGEFQGPGAGMQGMDSYDVFDAFFGEPSGLFGGREASSGTTFNFRSNGNRGLDIRENLSLSFEESIFGGQRNINVTHFETCDSCNGTGAKSSSGIQTCRQCGGRGGTMKSQRTPFGVVSQVSTCSKCGGEGTIITDRCPKCSGDGRLQSQRKVKVEIPPGVKDGLTMQVQGEGHVDKKRGIVGDLYLFLHVNEKPGIQRDGLNLYSTINIDYTEAILGAAVKVETVEGFRDLQIPPGIQSGETIKMPNMGVPNIKKPSVRGDHNFIVTVGIPKKISGEERKLVEKLVSLRTSRKDYSIPSEEKLQEDFENWGKAREGRATGKGIRSISSFWNSIKKILGKKGSRTRFASLSFEAMVPTWIPPLHGRDSSLVISFSMFFVLIYIYSFMVRIVSRRLKGWNRSTEGNISKTDDVNTVVLH